MTFVSKTRKATHDLDEIWYYIAVDSPSSADSLLEEIYSCAHILSENPKMGRPRPELGKNILSFPIKRYVMFYFIIKDGIQLIRVLHSSRDSMLIAKHGGFNA